MSTIPYFKDNIASLDKKIKELIHQIENLEMEREANIDEMQNICPHPDFAIKHIKNKPNEPLEAGMCYSICYICNKQV
jgi:hypothetical protein